MASKLLLKDLILIKINIGNKLYKKVVKLYLFVIFVVTKNILKRLLMD